MMFIGTFEKRRIAPEMRPMSIVKYEKRGTLCWGVRRVIRTGEGKIQLIRICQLLTICRPTSCGKKDFVKEFLVKLVLISIKFSGSRLFCDLHMMKA